MGCNDGVTQALCEARMAVIENKLDSMSKQVDRIAIQIEDFLKTCNPDISNLKARLEIAEKELQRVKDSVSSSRIIALFASIVAILLGIVTILKSMGVI